MAIDRDLVRAAKARRRALRRAQRSGRLALPLVRATRVPIQVGRHEPVDDAELTPAAPPAPAPAPDAGLVPAGGDRASLGTWTAPVLPDHFVTQDQLAAHETEAQALQAELAAVRDRIDDALRRR